MPAEQTSPALQALAQAPQFFRSFCRLTHRSLQSVRPVWQLRAHLPALQIWPALQASPHLPQLLTSFCRLRHLPLQSVSPLWQVRAHLPLEQTWPALQAPPQAPQLKLSVFMLAQYRAPASPPPHLLCPDGHVMVQAPAMQTWPDGHLAPHLPQLVALLEVLTHVLPHWVKGEMQLPVSSSHPAANSASPNMTSTSGWKSFFMVSSS